MKAPALKLVLDLGSQYTGFNNGYLCPAWELMRNRGWRSRETLFIAIAEAEHFGMIVRTRQGGRNRASLYALTWWQIHGKDGDPLDLRPTTSPAHEWKQDRPVFQLPDWIVAHRNKLKENSKGLHVLRAA